MSTSFRSVNSEMFLCYFLSTNWIGTRPPRANPSVVWWAIKWTTRLSGINPAMNHLLAEKWEDSSTTNPFNARPDLSRQVHACMALVMHADEEHVDALLLPFFHKSPAPGRFRYVIVIAPPTYNSTHNYSLLPNLVLPEYTSRWNPPKGAPLRYVHEQYACTPCSDFGVFFLDIVQKYSEVHFCCCSGYRIGTGGQCQSGSWKSIGSSAGHQ